MFDETTMRKWNYTTHDYDPYSVPADWLTPLVNDDMDLVINCASCGAQKPFGEMFTSKTIHNPFGFGFNVCVDCHDKEVDVERRHNGVRDNG